MCKSLNLKKIKWNGIILFYLEETCISITGIKIFIVITIFIEKILCWYIKSESVIVWKRNMHAFWCSKHCKDFYLWDWFCRTWMQLFDTGLKMSSLAKTGLSTLNGIFDWGQTMSSLTKTGLSTFNVIFHTWVKHF